MAEPTIEAMLEWAREAVTQENADVVAAIYAILKQHQARTKSPGNTYEVAIIKSFVERVEQRLPDYTTGRTADSRLREYRRAVYSELEAMENESK